MTDAAPSVEKLTEHEQRSDELFHRLDKNNDGRVDVNELIDLLEQTEIEASSSTRVDTARVSPTAIVRACRSTLFRSASFGKALVRRTPRPSRLNSSRITF